MATSLTGRRGWTTVASLTAVLGGLLAVQLPQASAAGPVAPVVVAAPSSLDVDGVRLGWRPSARTAPKPVVAAKPAARPVVVAPAVARPAPVRAAVAPAAAPSALCSGAGWQERRGQAALASLKGGSGKAGYRITFEGARKGVMGLTYLDERRIAMFVRPCGTQSTDLLRHVMAHELGHAHDTELMTAALRTAWLRARGIPASTPWYGCSGCTDFATPAGDFAEVYAQWARGASTNRSQLAGDVPAAQLAALAQRFFAA